MKLSVVGALFIAHFGLSSLLACSCIERGPACSTYWSGKAVFTGQVISIQSDTEHGLLVDLQVIEPFRGVTSGQLVVKTGRGGGDCGYPFEVGKRYLVFADGEPLSTGICNDTTPIERAAQALEYIHGLAKAAPGGTLYGTLHHRDATGKFTPMAGVTVTATGPSAQTAVTDAAGEYRFNGIPAGEYLVKPSFAANLVNHEAKVSVPDRGCAERSFYTQSDGHIRGRVLDAAGKGIPDVDVQAVPWTKRNLLQGQLSGNVSTLYASTDASGAYDLGLVLPGEYMVVAGQFPQVDNRKPSYAPQYYPGAGSRNGAVPVSVGDGGKVADLNFTLGAALARKKIAVRTQLADGTPAANVQLLYAPAEMGYLYLGTPNSDAEGAAQVEMLEHTRYLICAQARGAAGGRVMSAAVVVDSSEVVKSVVLVLDRVGVQECPGYRQLATGQP